MAAIEHVSRTTEETRRFTGDTDQSAAGGRGGEGCEEAYKGRDVTACDLSYGCDLVVTIRRTTFLVTGAFSLSPTFRY